MLGTAAAIVMSTPEAARQLVEEFPELGATARRRDSERLRRGRLRRRCDAAARRPRSSASCTPVTSTRRAGLRQRDQSSVRRLVGGGRPGVEILTRSHYFLLEAIEQLLDATRASGSSRAASGRRDLGRRPRARRAVGCRRPPRLHVARRVDRADALRRPALPADAAPRAGAAFDDGARQDLRVPRVRAADPGGGPAGRRARPGRRVRAWNRLRSGRRRRPRDGDRGAMSDRTEPIGDDGFARRFSYEALAGEVASVVGRRGGGSSTGSSHATRHQG